jgi:oxygen-independent coproporphyrinogen III oxidase
MNSSRINRLYFHIPFCTSKCDYCAFHSLPSPSESLIEQYFNYIEKEIKKNIDLAGELDSIYIGGGTPSLLSPFYLKKLFSLIRNNYAIKENAEISIECNPDSLNLEKIKIISNFANRVSIGIQSFNDKIRKILGRNGSISDIDYIINKFTENNLTNLSMDLIYGIPNQTLNDFELDLNKLLKYPIKHTSLYSLTFEEGTQLSKNLNCTEKDFDELSVKSWHLANDILKTNNLYRYEVSNYSLNGFECKHNLETWFGSKYFGLGPTASSFHGNIRWTNATFKQWIKEEPPEIDKISNKDRFIEIFLMGLRTNSHWIIEDKDQYISLESNFNTDCYIKF